ncbi:MAG: Spx/MgsR family RNA polymerase-binding regulatory protein [Gammaproteobacteria bacterium]|nr:Spx/MgsR family RNA polymerase-binding regulatory protein [Gammaproteobacteria bacterium]
MSSNVKVYGLKNCDSCRNTMRLFKSLDVPATLIDVRDHPPDNTTLLNWCKRFGWTALLNKRSTTWRTLNAAQKSVADEHAAVQLLRDYPTLMKRPVILCGSQQLLGFDRHKIESLCT